MKYCDSFKSQNGVTLRHFGIKYIALYSTGPEPAPISLCFASKEPELLLIFKVILSNSFSGFLKVFQMFSLDSAGFSLIFSPALVSDHFQRIFLFLFFFLFGCLGHQMNRFVYT